MAANDKKISSLTELFYQNIVDTANIVVAFAGLNYRVAMSTIRQYVLGDRTIGGAGLRDIVTTGDEQMLAYKRLEEPSFNSDVRLNSNVTATQMNHLSGLGQNVQNALNSIGGDILTIENRIDDLEEDVGSIALSTFVATYDFNAGGSNFSFLADQLSPDVSMVDPEKVIAQIYILNGTARILDTDVVIQINVGESNTFHSISLSGLEPGKQYSFRVLSNV